MADKKISQLTAATLPLAGTEVLPLVQTSTKKVAVADLLGGVTVSSGFSASITGGGTVYLGAANSYGDLALLKNAAGVTKIGVSNDDGTAGSGATFSSYYGNTEIGAFGHYWNGGEFINRIKYFSKQEFAEGTTVRVRIEQTSGDLTAVTGNFVVGTAGKGIDFSANANAPGMTSEVLTWYEEGNWTPVLNRASAGAINASYVSQIGKYVRLGNMVTVSGFVELASVTSQGTGDNYISGLPYAPAANSVGAGAVSRNSAFTTIAVTSCFSWTSGVLYFRDATNGVSPVSADWTTGYVNFSIVYFV